VTAIITSYDFQMTVKVHKIMFALKFILETNSLIQSSTYM